MYFVWGKCFLIAMFFRRKKIQILEISKSSVIPEHLLEACLELDIVVVNFVS